jgi:hypothetical protein
MPHYHALGMFGFWTDITLAPVHRSPPVSLDICQTRTEASVVLLCYDEAQSRAVEIFFVHSAVDHCQSVCNALYDYETTGLSTFNRFTGCYFLSVYLP